MDEFLLSPHWTRLVLITLLLLLPSVVMLAWFHGRPGKERDSLARTEKIGIPANFLSAAVHVALATEGADAAIEAHRQASEAVEAGDYQVTPAIPARVLGDLASIRDRAGDYAGAAESYRAAIALWPEGRYHRGAGRALRRAGLLDEAEAELREALRLVPADPHAHLEMALLMEARGDIDAAVEHLGSALAVWEYADEEFEPARRARAKLAELGTLDGLPPPPVP